MKKLLLFTFLIVGITSTYAQNSTNEIEVNPLILEFYPESKVQTLLEQQPEEILFWNAIYDYGYSIEETPSMKIKDTKIFKEIVIEDLNKVNVLAMNIYPTNEIQYFRIKDTNKLLIMKSKKMIKEWLTTQK